MKVYLVLLYMHDYCRIDRVYTTKKLAYKRVRLLSKIANPNFTLHVIAKTLKGVKK